MRAVVGVAVAWIVLHGGLTAPATAQAVRGTVREADGGRALTGARLLLLNDAGEAVDSTVSDGAGSFRLVAPVAGSYMAYFQMNGWASVPSESVTLTADSTATLDFRVTLISNEALRQMSDIIGLEPRLQAALPELCGEALRPWEAGLLIGRVRAGGTDRPIARARVAVIGRDAATVRATVSSENGVYVLCNVPAGSDVAIVAEAPAGGVDTTRVEVRAGSAGWYDLFVRVPRR